MGGELVLGRMPNSPYPQFHINRTRSEFLWYEIQDITYIKVLAFITQ
jgi:hypothetical protein